MVQELGVKGLLEFSSSGALMTSAQTDKEQTSVLG